MAIGCNKTGQFFFIPSLTNEMFAEKVANEYGIDSKEVLNLTEEQWDILSQRRERQEVLELTLEQSEALGLPINGDKYNLATNLYDQIIGQVSTGELLLTVS